MTETIQVQIRFTAETKHGTFTDCLYKSLDEYAALKEEDKDAEKQARVDAYVSGVDNAPAPVEPTLEQLEAEKAALEAYLVDINAKIAAK